MWQVLAGGWQALIRLGASTILARTLVPSDFGLFGMALLVIELVDYLGGLGMTGGVIAKKDVGDRELNTCFWTMAGVRFLLFCITFASAQLSAMFMKEPRVEGIIKVISLTFLVSIFGIIGNAILAKKLQFGKISIINSLAMLFESAFAVYLAKTTTLGYWALVYPMLISSLIINLSIFIAAKWYPRFIFDKESFRFQFKFGINGFGFNIANYLYHNLDYFLVGRIMGTTSLGLYEYAFKIPHIVLDRLSRPVGAVVFPALAKVQDDDSAIISGFVEAVKYVTVIAFPVLGGLAAIAEPLVLMLWGEQWKPIVLPMQILCLCAALRCSVQPIGAVFLCKHMPEIPLKQSIISLIFTLLFVGLGVWYLGLVGAALGMTIATSSYVYSIYKAFSLTRTSFISMLRAIAPSILSSIMSSVMAYIAYVEISNCFTVSFVLFCSITIGAFSYISCYFLLFKNDMISIFSKIANIIANKA